MATQVALPRLAVFSLGGTIASINTTDPSVIGVVPQLGAHTREVFDEWLSAPAGRGE